jgi:hypothetical protein
LDLLPPGGPPGRWTTGREGTMGNVKTKGRRVAIGAGILALAAMVGAAGLFSLNDSHQRGRLMLRAADYFDRLKEIVFPTKPYQRERLRAFQAQGQKGTSAPAPPISASSPSTTPSRSATVPGPR